MRRERRIQRAADRRGQQHLGGGSGERRTAEQCEPPAAVPRDAQQQQVRVGVFRERHTASPDQVIMEVPAESGFAAELPTGTVFTDCQVKGRAAR
jgi:hypothetical protein